LFLSTDPVAADSVMVDYLESEGANIWTNGDPRTYLRVAASDGLGTYETSPGNFDYSVIDLVRCEPNCPGTSPPPAATQTPTTTPEYHPGDVNLDGQVSTQDILLLFSLYGKDSWLDIYAPDANSDGLVNLVDFGFVLKNWL
jgi:hypothetical protein